MPAEKKEDKILTPQEVRQNNRVMFLKKKNEARKMLDAKGVQKREGTNEHGQYNYFTEAQYKKLFTEIFSKVGLEMSCEEVAIRDRAGTERQPFGCRVTLAFTLTDIDTGYSETVHSTGEGIDNSDKAIYKAKTGALKYWLANNFMVATGDDPEKDSPDDSNTATKPKAPVKTATDSQIALIKNLYSMEEIQQMLGRLNLPDMKALTIRQASDMIAARKGK